MKEEDVRLFKVVSSRLDEMYKEISEMSKKKPDNPVNKFKLGLINEILTDVNLILKDEYKPFNDFNDFDESDLPTNSDITVVLSQYKNAMENFRCDNIILSGYTDWYWLIDGEISSVKTNAPSSKFKRL